VTKHDRPASALIVARSFDLREGLHSLLTVTPRISSIAQAGDGPSALRQIGRGCPDLVLLDFDLPHEDVLTVLKEIKRQCPEARSLVLTDQPQHQREVRFAGADLVLLKGYPAVRLIAAITELLGKR
jgi:DNA-binding NarL/FixJ family response regulator